MASLLRHARFSACDTFTISPADGFLFAPPGVLSALLDVAVFLPAADGAALLAAVACLPPVPPPVPPLRVGGGSSVPPALLPSWLREGLLAQPGGGACCVLRGDDVPTARAVALRCAELDALPPSSRALLAAQLARVLDGWVVAEGGTVCAPWGRRTLRATVESAAAPAGAAAGVPLRIRAGTTVLALAGAAGTPGGPAAPVSPWKKGSAIAYAGGSPARAGVPAPSPHPPQLPVPAPASPPAAGASAPAFCGPFPAAAPSLLPGLPLASARLWEALVWPLAAPELFLPPHGLRAPAGVLLHGPPGCGKTALVGALVGAARRALAPRGVVLHFAAVAGGEVLSGVPGRAEAALGALFAAARTAAEAGGGALLFFDEVDALCPARGGSDGGTRGASGAQARAAAMLIACLDAPPPARGRLLVVAASNRPAAVDPALLRLGRFDCEVRVAPPAVREREAIFRSHLRCAGRALAACAEAALPHLAASAVGFVGADIAAAVRGASALAGAPPAPVTARSLREAAARVGASALRGEGAHDAVCGGAGEGAPFSRIGGAARALERLAQAVVAPAGAPARAAALRVAPPRGVLLHGPPGNSKTSLARALAAALGASFFSLSGGALLSPFLGEAERRVRALFARARAAPPAVLFFDELDALVGLRGARGAPGARALLATLLTELDGVAGGGNGLLVVGATNRPRALDPALLRSGRLELHVEVPLPDARGRAEILTIHARRMPLGSDVCFGDVAAATAGWSGARLAGLCRHAAAAALRAAAAAAEADATAPSAPKLLPLRVTAAHFAAALAAC